MRIYGKIMMLALAFSLASAVSADVVDTYGGAGATSQTWLEVYANGGYLSQGFEVPSGNELTEVRLYVHDSKTYVHESYAANFWLCNGPVGTVGSVVQSALVAQSSLPAGTGYWLTMTLDTPAPAGSYYMMVSGNNDFMRKNLHVWRWEDGGYADGEAATGVWGGTPYSTAGRDVDFQGQFVMEVIPEPATLGLLASAGAGLLLIRRKLAM